MKFWKQLLIKLQEKKKLYLLTVVQNSGSSPGRKGFKMLVVEDGFIFGSIGGGVMEFSLVEEVRQLLKQTDQPIFLKRQIHKGKIKDGSGMICSGEQTVVFHPLNSKHVLLIENLVSSLTNNKKGILSMSFNTIAFELGEINSKYQFEMESPKKWSFKEQLGSVLTLYIVGGGHVGLAVSKLFCMLGFYVVVFDNRDSLNTFTGNEFADEKHVINYSEISTHIVQGNDSYVAVMTNTFKEDKLVLSKLIKNEYKFLGVLGSKAKLKTIFKVLEEKDGFAKAEISKIKGPIGLAISSQTPEEIAVSIAAQVIAIKNKV